jgi:hypothetical protein
MAKGALRGFATVELPIGLKIHDMPVLVGRNRAWVNLPAKPQIDKDGRPKTGADGKAAYAAILNGGIELLRIGSARPSSAWSAPPHPDALDGVGA